MTYREALKVLGLEYVLVSKPSAILVRSLYLAAARRCHPDVAPGHGEEWLRLQEAYRRAIDELSRESVCGTCGGARERRVFMRGRSVTVPCEDCDCEGETKP